MSWFKSNGRNSECNVMCDVNIASFESLISVITNNHIPCYNNNVHGFNLHMSESLSVNANECI